MSLYRKHTQKPLNQQQQNVNQPTAQVKSEGSRPSNTNERKSNVAKKVCPQGNVSSLKAKLEEASMHKNYKSNTSLNCIPSESSSIKSGDETKRREQTNQSTNQENLPKIKRNYYGSKFKSVPDFNKYENDAKLANGEIDNSVYENVDPSVDERVNPDRINDQPRKKPYQGSSLSAKSFGTFNGVFKNVQETGHGMHKSEQKHNVEKPRAIPGEIVKQSNAANLENIRIERNEKEKVKTANLRCWNSVNPITSESPSNILRNKSQEHANFNFNRENVGSHSNDSAGYESSTMYDDNIYDTVEYSPSIKDQANKVELPCDEDDFGFAERGVRNKNIEKLWESRCKQEKRKWNEAIKELIHTEEKYLERLEIVVENYIPLLERTALKNLPSQNFTKKNIFCNIEKIYYFHKNEILPAFKQQKTNFKQLAKVFENEQFSTMYVEYNVNLIKNVNRKKNEIDNFSEAMKRVLNHNLDLNGYLLEPIQRVCKYPIMMENIIKSYEEYAKKKQSWPISFATETINDDEILKAFKDAEDATKRVLSLIDNVRSNATGSTVGAS
ncbi:uncharacterized protein LOC143915878 [Arctopsyche grandis]|uniref:uncharacterized protein LOC143915878 n=1 Tax=Arctopsyche grandis TaxID=121162 RepID=UPI00406D9A26